MTYFPKFQVSYSDSPSVDAFGRVRMSSARTLFDSKMLASKNSTYWAEFISGSSTSTHTASLAQVGMQVPASDGACVIRQTKMRFNYSPAKSNVFFGTGRLPPEDGTIKRIGLFDSPTTAPYEPYNGVYFEMSGTVPSWCIALTGGIKQVTQENWNLDKLDGTGISGISMSFDNCQIWTLDREWLGVGRVRAGFNIDGSTHYCHEFLHANNETNVYIGSPNLPIRYEIRSAGSAGSMYQICSTVISEDGSGEKGEPNTVSTKTDPVDADVANEFSILCGIRLVDGQYDAQVEPSYISIMEETKGDFWWALHMNPTVTGSINWVAHEDDNLVEVMSGSGQTITVHPDHMGKIIAQGYSTDTTPLIREITSELRIGVDITGSRDELYLSAAPRDVLSDFLASFGWYELS